MLAFIINTILGNQNQRQIKRLWPLAQKINSLEQGISSLSDSQLAAKTDEFKKRIKDEFAERFEKQDTFSLNEDELKEYHKEEKSVEKEILNGLLPEAFAVCREAARRAVNMRHFDVQLIGGMVLHDGKIAEMATGEGKTLVATLAAYLNALTGRGVHIVTVNDYLAKRDRYWMGPVYEFLGLSVGCIQHDMAPSERQIAYRCDITYGTNNEFGFDYLRDNMVVRLEDMVQRELNFAIVDEVDSILIDEARTPLIISGPSDESTELYYKIDKIIPKLSQGKRDEITKQETGDFIVDEKAHTAYLTEQGELKAAELLGIKNMHDLDSMEYKHHVNQALRAHTLFKLDVDYVIKDGEVLIVDEFTGRLMPGRRWSDGLHQAVEAKEGVRIERENQTLATITFQNYFRMFRKLAGMTGTAVTEAAEFSHIYKLDVVTIPTNRPLIRHNAADAIYKTERAKFKAAAEEIAGLYEKGKPVLVGTISIEKSERLSHSLHKIGVPHEVLNAKYHEKEAYIVAQAGRLKQVTIATNMAGRGTDILLGGNAEFIAKDILSKQDIGPGHPDYNSKLDELLPRFKKICADEHNKVVELGGLHVMGTERHDARRIDNQLRGRSGRQGDPGSSKFYVSLEDQLMRIFGSNRIVGIMDRLGFNEDEVIQHPFISKAIETAQKRVEEYNFEIRKHLLEYDNVMNKQREVIYKERRQVLENSSLNEIVIDMIDDIVAHGVDIYCNKDLTAGEWDIDGLSGWVKMKFGAAPLTAQLIDLDRDAIYDKLSQTLKVYYSEKEKKLGPEMMGFLLRQVLLEVIDSKWKDHLYAMDNLREGIGLRAYGQRDPLIEYQGEAYNAFQEMIASIKEEAVEFIFKVEPIKQERLKSVFFAAPQELSHPEAMGIDKIHQKKEIVEEGQFSYSQGRAIESKPQTVHREAPKVGRNDPCPCGSGKKYKKCCGK